MHASNVGRRFPSEKKAYIDEITGQRITVLTSSPANDVRIYQTHPQWTADGKWILFHSKDRSTNGKPQAFAVNENSGEIVQLSDDPNFDPRSLTLSRKENAVYYRRLRKNDDDELTEVVKLSLDPILSNAAAAPTSEPYENIVATVPGEIGDMDLDAEEKNIYFRQTLPKTDRSKALDAKDNLGRFGFKAYTPNVIRKLEIATGKVEDILTTDFTVGHLQASPFVPGEFIFCHETGDDALQRMWIRHPGENKAQPLFKEEPSVWVTHEAFASKDEVVFNLMGHTAKLREKPTGIAMINLRDQSVKIFPQPKETPKLEDDRGFWHCNASPDGRWIVGDTFSGNVYLIDRKNGETTLLTTDHKMRPDHTHPAFSANSKRILIQSGHLTDGKNLDLMVIKIPETLDK
ncbi:MAG: hypothetical protein ACK5LK_09165 [Chthoniobacterales bacterium]